MVQGVRSATAAKERAMKDLCLFVRDCLKPVENKIMEISSLEKFLQRIKVTDGKAGALGDSVVISRDKIKINITFDRAFFKRSVLILPP